MNCRWFSKNSNIFLPEILCNVSYYYSEAVNICLDKRRSIIRVQAEHPFAPPTPRPTSLKYNLGYSTCFIGLSVYRILNPGASILITSKDPLPDYQVNLISFVNVDGFSLEIQVISWTLLKIPIPYQFFMRKKLKSDLDPEHWSEQSIKHISKQK